MLKHSASNSQYTPELAALDSLKMTTEFFLTKWRHEPQVFPGLARNLAVSRDWSGNFESWCRAPAQARLFLYHEDGGAEAAEVPEPNYAYEIFKKYQEGGDELTLMLNNVEKVDEKIESIQGALGVCRDWRKGDVVATLSTVGSGIGYHAGNEDGFIIQLEGARWWRVWSETLVPNGPRLALLGFPGSSGYKMSRPEEPPIIDFKLSEGDVLYIPPLYGHEGVTERKSVSLALSWRGVSPFTALAASIGMDNPLLLELAHKSPSAYSALLPDPPFGHDNAHDIRQTILQLALNMVDAPLSLRTLIQELR